MECRQTFSLSVLKQDVIRYSGGGLGDGDYVLDAVKVSAELINCLVALVFDISDFIACL